jgi:hypothetical protein
MKEEYDALLDLLKRAASKLQDYCAEADGERNDPLAMEIELELKAETPLRDADGASYASEAELKGEPEDG